MVKRERTKTLEELSTPIKTLEKLSFELNPRDLANFKSTLKIFGIYNYNPFPAKYITSVLKDIDTIGELLLNSKIYAFNVIDTYVRNNDQEGVELFLRQGNTLIDYYQIFPRDAVPSVNDCVEFLKENKHSEIYTGPLQLMTRFLNLEYERDEDDSYTSRILSKYEVREFEDNGIKVITLDSLI